MYNDKKRFGFTVYLYVLGIAAVAVALFVSHQNILTLFLGAFMYFFGALGTRYAYNIRKFGNRWHDTLNRRERADASRVTLPLK